MTSRRSVALVVLCAALFSTVVVTIRFAKSAWDPSMFVRAGHVYAHRGQTPKNLTIIDGIGYDGQFYYRLARDPFSGERTKLGITLDMPGRRQQRILYPLLAWILSGGGKAGAVLWVLILINAIGLALIAWIGTVLVRMMGRSSWWGLAFVLVPGAIVSLTHDTGEVVAILLALCFLTWFRQERFVVATLALTAAVFARETTAVFALGLLVAAFIVRRSPGRRTMAWCALVPLVAYGAWQVLLGFRWSGVPVLTAGGHDIGPVPFYGLITASIHWFGRGARVSGWNIVFSLGSLAFLALALRAFKRSRAPVHERAAFIVAVLLVPFLRADVWFNFTSFLRAMSEAMILGLIGLLASGPPPSISGLSTGARASAGTP